MEDMNDDPLPVVTTSGTNGQMAELYKALAAAQGEFGAIVKNRSVSIDIKDENRKKIGSYTFRYADLEEITAKTRPALSRHGLATVQMINPSSGGTSLFTRLLHSGGAELVSEVLLPVTKGDIKAYGATISYLRRYAKSSLLDIAADDDLDENGQEGDSDQAQATTTASTTVEADDGYYTDELFQKNLPNWTAAITGKKSTPDRVIKMASSKRKLTDDQIAIINAIQPTETAQ